MPIQEKLLGFCGALLLNLILMTAHAQTVDSVTRKAMHFPSSLDTGLPKSVQGLLADPVAFANEVGSKTKRISNRLARKDRKYLAKFSSLESRLLSRLKRKNMTAAMQINAGEYQKYIRLMQDLGKAIPFNAGRLSYNANLDTLKASLRYLKSMLGLTEHVGGTQQKLAGSLQQVQELENRLAMSAQVEKYLQERKAVLSRVMQQYAHLPVGAASIFTRYKEMGFYYRQQLKVYKDELNDPDKIEKRAIAALSQTPSYVQFMSQHSELAALFPKPEGLGTPTALNGLQSRSQVQEVLQKTASSSGQSGQQYIQEQADQAQGMLSRMKASVSKYGQSGVDLDMPDFKPNSQKTKTFLKRLEYGANVQFGKSTTYLPATGNLALSVGYMINDRSTLGVGAGYIFGMGSGLDHLRFSSQGLTLRTFMDWKIKGTYYVTGGYEQSYLTGISSIAQLKDRSAWQQSALIGLEKKYRINSKLTGEVQLLYNPLYKQALPPGQMIQFRVGYNFQ